MIKLGRFDEKFLKTIKDYKKIHIKPKEGIYYTIIKDNKKAGVIGFKQKEGGYFLKIGIHQDFRGQGIFEKALKLLVKKHGIKEMQSTISKSNVSSIKAHKKLGFKRVPKKIEELLIGKGLLLKRNIRMIKNFS